MDARRRHQAARRSAPRRRLRLLGAILAGGRSSRFGSDKALAILHEKPLIEHVADGLRSQVCDLIVVGRPYPGFRFVADEPASGLGPLGGLCGALLHGETGGFDAVMTAPCDAVTVPDLRGLLPATGGVVSGWPLFGLWPVAHAQPLLDHLEKGGDRSVFGWVAAAGMPEFPAPTGLVNINRPADLAVRAKMVGDGSSNS